MKKLLLGLLVLASLSVASAQGRLFGEALGGDLRLAPGFSLSLNATAGAERLLGPLDLRGGVAIAAAGGGASFGIFADVLYPLELQSVKLNLGGGLGLQFGGGSEFDLRGIAGLEFPIQSYFSLLTELRLVLGFAGGGTAVGLDILVGPRVYFR